ncbi:MAG TPA: SPOR domain-containing protein, partial [candidate division Zixibacteria bacterium]|nr:SPOR domain-containing protein [candidate division Zixibacteria bacterium]
MFDIVKTTFSVRQIGHWLSVVALVAALGAVSGCAEDPAPEPAVNTQPKETTAAAVDTPEAPIVVAAKPVVTEPEPEMPPHERLSPEYGVYTVQIGSYDSRERAQPFLAKLAAEGLEPYLIDEVITANGEERLVFRLRFG